MGPRTSSKTEAWLPFYSHIIKFCTWDSLIGGPSTVILTARKETLPRTVLKVIPHGHDHPSVHLSLDRGTDSCRYQLQGAALAYTAAPFCPSICYKVPEPRPPSPLPGRFREISICMLAQSRSMPHTSLQPRARRSRDRT